ncbi:MMPL family transporter [Embleya sp. NPDC050493]|uniref:MMPL family transporter n=1 Tax=Embleya sp. NPDC050493 TaxID=3363989 RepID=UPI0037AAC2C5
MTTQTSPSAPADRPADAPSPAPPPTLFGRYAAFVAGRRSKWVVLVCWLLLIGVGGSLAAKLGSVQNNEQQTWLPADSQATRALDIADEHFTNKGILTAVVVYTRDRGLTPGDLARIGEDRGRLRERRMAAAEIPDVVVSQDGKAAYLTVPLKADKSDNAVLGDAVEAVRKLTGEGAPAGLDVRIAGQAGNLADFIDVYSGMDATLLGTTLAIVALLLLITYRSPVLWLIPLISVALASQVASGVVYLLARYAGLVVNGQSSYVLVVLVLGVGTDYALLLIARYREELHRHRDRHEAMATALTRCLPAIAASAATVGIATLCLVFGSMNSTRGLGPVVAIGVVIVFCAMTSLLPAFLVVLGRWVFWPLIPRHTVGYQGVGVEREHGAWARVSRAVGLRPRPIWIGSVLVLAALACGALTLGSGQTAGEQFTERVDSVIGQERLAEHFAAGSSAPADVYVRSEGAAATVRMLPTVPGVSSATEVASAGGWTHIAAVLRDSPDTGAARDTIERIRATLRSGPAQTRSALVAGQSAVALDTSQAQGEEEKLLIPLILAVVLLMLVVLLRALVAPVVLLLSVVLSFGSAVGAAALIYHALGHPRIDRGLLLFGFLFLVALGVDYTIFLMTRAREEVRVRGHREGVLTGLTVTGGVITSAGLVLAATFAALTVIPTVNSLQQGVLVAVGVLLDTFLVRSLLIPALALEIGPRFWRPGRAKD